MKTPLEFGMVLSLALAVLVSAPRGSLGQEIVKDIPKGCNNNAGIYRVEGSAFYVGPLWLRPCKNVCEFNSAGTAIRRQTVWYVPQFCGGRGKAVITRAACVADTRASNCFIVKPDESDPRNHDCRSHGSDWSCTGIEKTITCPDVNLADRSRGLEYKRNISVPDCRQVGR